MALDDLALRPREGAPIRCALCRGEFVTEPCRCSGCATLTHADCLATAEACPTIGCAERGVRRPGPSRPRTARAGQGPQGSGGEAPRTLERVSDRDPSDRVHPLGVFACTAFTIAFAVYHALTAGPSPKVGQPLWATPAPTAPLGATELSDRLAEDLDRSRDESAARTFRLWALLARVGRGAPVSSGEELAAWFASKCERDPAWRREFEQRYVVRGDGPSFFMTDLGLDHAPGGTGVRADRTWEVTIDANFDRETAALRLR